jgi:acid phosphatase type 7
MSIKVSDRPTLPRTQRPDNPASLIMKWFVALGLMVIAAMNISDILPVMTPPTVQTSTPTEVVSALTFKAEADAHVQEEDPAANAGTSADLEVIRANGQSAESYLRFTVSGLSGAVQSARLRVYSTTETAENGPALYATENTWTETEITWENRPRRASNPSGDQTLVRKFSWVEYDVMALVKEDGTYSFVLAGDSDEGLLFSSRESSNGPELILTIASATPTSAASSTPEGTGTPGTGNALTFTAEADAHILQSSPAANYGTADDLPSQDDPEAAQISYIRFSVSGIDKPVQNVKLRVFATNGSNDGPSVHFADSSWKEAGVDGITWNQQPTLLSGPMENKEAVEENSWLEYDVTAAVTGDGMYSFALVADSEEEVTFSSREGVKPPQLIVTTGLVAPTSTPRPVSRVSPGDVILVGAGDIATCDREEDELTAQLLDNIPGTVFTVGDNAYVDGSYSDYLNCYEPTWGRHKARTKPSPGNHEYNTSGAAGYFQYFNNVPSYYAYELGTWRIYALNSEINVSESSDQVRWLEDDLAANPSQCVLAYWHTPRWSSGAKNGSQPALQSIWQILYEAGAELVVNGHEHNYERFAEMDASGAEASQGLREIVVGTGGAGLYEFGTPLAASEVRDNTSFGVLKLTLRATDYDWEFVPAENSTFTDSGSGNCH